MEMIAVFFPPCFLSVLFLLYFNILIDKCEMGMMRNEWTKIGLLS